MLIEQYTLTLKRELVSGTGKEDRTPIDPPIVLRYSINRIMSPGSYVIVNRMMDEFKVRF